MVTEAEPGVVGVPLTTPVEALIDRPAGRPEAVQVSVAVDEVSVAAGVKAEMAEPVALALVPGLVTTTVLVMVQVNETELETLALSLAVMVTEKAPAVVGVPLMTPVEELMDRPVGRPEALQVSVATDEVSVAVAVMGEMAVPDTFDLADVVGLVTATVLVMVHEKLADPAKPAVSVAVMVTE